MTDDRSTARDVPQVVRVMQIICLALAAGPVMFAVIVSMQAIPKPEDPNGVFSLIGYGFGAVSFLAGLVVGPMVRNAGAKHASANGAATPEGLVVAYQTSFIISSAMTEGGAFLNVLCYMLEGSIGNLIFAGLLIVANLLKFPTIGRVNDWIEATQRRLRDEQSFTSG